MMHLTQFEAFTVWTAACIGVAALIGRMTRHVS